MKHVIVTGATGFIGRNLIKEFVENGIAVKAVVREMSAKTDFLKEYRSVTPVICPLSEISKLPDMLGIVPPDTVFCHLAWEGTAGVKRGDYRLQLRNVEYTVEAVKAAQAMNCEGFIGAGSIMEYESTVAVYNINESPSQANIYSTAKLTAHYMSKIISANSNIRYVWPYITNAYGEEEVSPRFLNTTVRKFLSGESPVFSAATQMYDFIHIHDVARAFYMLCQYGKNGQVYCVGSGSSRPLKAYITKIRDLINPDVLLVFGNKPGISLDKKCFDTTLLLKDTGFHPQIPFEEGVLRLKKRNLQF